MTELVRLTTKDGVARISLDSPGNRNALSAGLRVQLLDCLNEAIEDDSTRVVVLTHDGPAFCSGADLREVSGRNGVTSDGPSLPEILDVIWHSATPVVARLAGPARAGGLGLVAACDIAVAAEDVSFALTEVRIGVVPAVISAAIFPRTNPAVIHELMLTGERFDARRAVEIGLVNHAVPHGQLDDEVQRLTDMLKLGGPNALAGTKRMLRARWPDFAAEMARLSDVSVQYFRSSEGKEGMSAFLDKRSPAWVSPGPSAKR